MQTKLAALTTCCKKFKSSLSGAAVVVAFVRVGMVLPRPVVVGTFCNKSSISLILIGNSVVVVLILSVVIERVVGLVMLLPRLRVKAKKKKPSTSQIE